MSSPGKRVRGMSDSNASLILNIQSYHSPTSSQYGHFPVSPQTPSRLVEIAFPGDIFLIILLICNLSFGVRCMLPWLSSLRL